MKDLSTREQRIIWAAGFFDGEGCIYFVKRGNPNKGSEAQTYNFYLRIAINQRRRLPLDEFQGVFGGRIYEYENKQGPMYQWYATTRKAAAVLEELRPYLILKADEANLALAFQERRMPRGSRIGQKGRGGRALNAELDQRDYIEMQNLKRRID